MPLKQQKKSLTFVSVEGFWEKTVHDKRIEEAALKLMANPSAFAIASATYAPKSCISFTDDLLGKYTAQKLIEDYNISAARILPAYLFPQNTTYTIIDAYSNSIMIGWMCSGLDVSNQEVTTELTPVSAGFREQQERILLLNKRAIDGLKKLLINVNVHPVSETMSYEDVVVGGAEEAAKLVKIKKPGEILDTGMWLGNSGITRKFGDIEAMRSEFIRAFSETFPIKNGEYDFLFDLSYVDRFLLTLVWNTKANIGFIDEDNWNEIQAVFSEHFGVEFDANLARTKFGKYIDM